MDRRCPVGSVARPEDGWDVNDVLGNCAGAIGDQVSMPPDGEIGDRYYWINDGARRSYAERFEMLRSAYGKASTRDAPAL